MNLKNGSSRFLAIGSAVLGGSIVFLFYFLYCGGLMDIADNFDAVGKLRHMVNVDVRIEKQLSQR